MRVWWSWILTCVAFILPMHSQHVGPTQKVPKAASRAFAKGKKLYQADQYDQAVIHFQKALKIHPAYPEAELMLASVYYETHDYLLAIKHFQHILALDSLYHPKIYYTLALCHYQADQYDQALKNMAYFLSLDGIHKELQQKAASWYSVFAFCDSAVRNAYPLHEVYLDQLNSLYSEYLPSLTGDGNTIVFTRRIHGNNEELFISTKTDSGEWSAPQTIPLLNSPFLEGAPAISPDGKTLVFASCDRKNSLGGCDLYFSHWENNRWSVPQNMGYPINTPGYESQPCFANNGRTLFFTSNRVGGLGGLDIWYSVRKSDGSWAAPLNAGNNVNTAGNEDCPHVHPNGRYLFFSSNGYLGMGAKDLFVSERNNIGEWMPPKNLGYPINSRGDENSLVVFPDGKHAIMASDKRHLGTAGRKAQAEKNLDLIQFQLPSWLQFSPSTWVDIFVFDETNLAPLKAKVEIFDLSNRQRYYSGWTDSHGKIFISLPADANYAIEIVKKNYVLSTAHFRTTGQHSPRSPLYLKKALRPLHFKESQPEILQNLFFESGSSAIRPESYFELDELISYLKEHEHLKIQIIGHTDNVGAPNENLILSVQRASAVVNYLIQGGIPPSRLQYDGRGETQPIAPNDTEAGRAMNRRTEFILIH